MCCSLSLSLLPEECAEVWSFDRPAAPAEGHHLVDGLGRVLRTLQHLTILNSASKWFSVSVNYKYSSGQCTIQCICIRTLEVVKILYCKYKIPFFNVHGMKQDKQIVTDLCKKSRS